MFELAPLLRSAKDNHRRKIDEGVQDLVQGHGVLNPSSSIQRHQVHFLGHLFDFPITVDLSNSHNPNGFLLYVLDGNDLTDVEGWPCNYRQLYFHDKIAVYNFEGSVAGYASCGSSQKPQKTAGSVHHIIDLYSIEEIIRIVKNSVNPFDGSVLMLVLDVKTNVYLPERDNETLLDVDSHVLLPTPDLYHQDVLLKGNTVILFSLLKNLHVICKNYGVGGQAGRHIRYAVFFNRKEPR
ncbi:hypothetical protein J6590_072324 [Homalodisca vitripennis]|nr:hypothetical protein J6590_072324 [Homalodisca vitripennis]